MMFGFAINIAILESGVKMLKMLPYHFLWKRHIRLGLLSGWNSYSKTREDVYNLYILWLLWFLTLASFIKLHLLNPEMYMYSSFLIIITMIKVVVITVIDVFHYNGLSFYCCAHKLILLKCYIHCLC